MIDRRHDQIISTARCTSAQRITSLKKISGGISPSQAVLATLRRFSRALDYHFAVHCLLADARAGTPYGAELELGGMTGEHGSMVEPFQLFEAFPGKAVRTHRRQSCKSTPRSHPWGFRRGVQSGNRGPVRYAGSCPRISNPGAVGSDRNPKVRADW